MAATGTRGPPPPVAVPLRRLQRTPMSTDACAGTGPLPLSWVAATASPTAATATRCSPAPYRYPRRPPSNPSPIHTGYSAPSPRSRSRWAKPCPAGLPSDWAGTICACNEQPAQGRIHPFGWVAHGVSRRVISPRIEGRQGSTRSCSFGPQAPEPPDGTNQQASFPFHRHGRTALVVRILPVLRLRSTVRMGRDHRHARLRHLAVRSPATGRGRVYASQNLEHGRIVAFWHLSTAPFTGNRPKRTLRIAFAWLPIRGHGPRPRLPRRRRPPREPPLAAFSALRRGAGVDPPQFQAFNARPAILSVSVGVPTQLRQRSSELSLPADGRHSVRASTAFA